MRGSWLRRICLILLHHRFDRIEVRRIRRRIEQPRTDSLEGLAYSPNLMRAEVVQDHDVVGAQRRGQVLPDLG